MSAPTATEQLVKDHKMIRKILGGLAVGSPDFTKKLSTLRRVVLGHAWFEDVFFLPAIKSEPRFFAPFLAEVSDEHPHIAALLERLETGGKRDRRDGLLTLRTLLETHFAKEEDVLFPLAEEALGAAALRDLAARMEKQKDRVRPGGPVVP